MPSCRNLLIDFPASGENSVFVYWQREATTSCTQGVLLVERGLGSKARILVFPLLTPLLGCHGKGAPAHWPCTPRKTFCCISKAGNSVPSSSPGTYKPLKEVDGQLEICPTPPRSQGCREPGPGPSMGLGRRRCASPSFGLMKTSVTSERLFVLTGIVI